MSKLDEFVGYINRDSNLEIKPAYVISLNIADQPFLVYENEENNIIGCFLEGTYFEQDINDIVESIMLGNGLDPYKD